VTAIVPIVLLRATINRLRRARRAARSRALFASACGHVQIERKARRDVNQLDRLIRNLKEAASV
jgi:hypothetical protein